MPNYVEVPDLLFKGAKVYVQLEDNATPSVPPSTPSTPPAPTPIISYPLSLLTLEDMMYLYRKDYDYKQALKALPGAHMIHYDLLTKNGKTWWDLTGIAQSTMQTDLNRVINTAGVQYAAETQRFDTTRYTGPLKAIVQNLINSKLGK